MPYVPVSPGTALPVDCDFHGEIVIPLFTPPYTIAEITSVTQEDWVFGASLDFAHISQEFGADQSNGINALTGMTDLILNPFSYVKWQYGTQSATAPYTSGRQCPRLGTQFSGTHFTFNTRKKVGVNTFFGQPNKNISFGLGNSGTFITTTTPTSTAPTFVSNPGFIGALGKLQIGFALANDDGFGGMDFAACEWQQPLLQQYFKIADFPLINAPDQAPPLPSFLEGGGVGIFNYSAIGNTFNASPYILKWDANAFTSGLAGLLKPNLSIASDQAILDNNEWVIETLPRGFLYIVNHNFYSTQAFTYYLISKEGNKYWRLKFAPMSALANSLINPLATTYTQIKFFIDIFGVAYYAAPKASGIAEAKNTILNSQGFSFPFQFDTTRLPYVSLPCWPPCYGVPLMKNNVL